MEHSVTWKSQFCLAKGREEKNGETERGRVQQRDSDSYTRLKLRGKWEKSLFLLLK